MTHVVVTVDCTDPDRLADFWAALLDYERFGSVAQYRSIRPRAGSTSGPKLIFQTVDEPKSVKNRLHLDVELDPGAPLEPAVERAVGLGASVVADGLVEEFGSRWRVMVDPEGNEFCIVAS